MTKKKFRIFY